MSEEREKYEINAPFDNAGVERKITGKLRVLIDEVYSENRTEDYPGVCVCFLKAFASLSRVMAHECFGVKVTAPEDIRRLIVIPAARETWTLISSAANQALGNPQSQFTTEEHASIASTIAAAATKLEGLFEASEKDKNAEA